jgi:SAM-dependent methyltransferase
MRGSVLCRSRREIQRQGSLLRSGIPEMENHVGAVPPKLERQNKMLIASETERVLDSMWRKYPEDLAPGQRGDIPRIAFHIDLVLSRLGRDISLWDIGGGIGMFSLGCAALGMKVTLVDDFGDGVSSGAGARILDLHRSYGIRVMQRDVVKDGLGLEGESTDAVTSFGSIEHWHSSPKAVLHAAARSLRAGGLMVVNAPNCVDIGKRIGVVLGDARWCSMEDWYETPVFRSHVREPSVADLIYIARDLGLTRCTILGRNWGRIEGLISRGGPAGIVARAADRILRLRPTLCTELYLLGHSSGAGTEKDRQPEVTNCDRDGLEQRSERQPHQGAAPVPAGT